MYKITDIEHYTYKNQVKYMKRLIKIQDMRKNKY